MVIGLIQIEKKYLFSDTSCQYIGTELRSVLGNWTHFNRLKENLNWFTSKANIGILSNCSYRDPKLTSIKLTFFELWYQKSFIN